MLKTFLTCLILLSATLGAYEKRVLAPRMTMQEVETLLGKPREIVDVQRKPGDINARFQEWHYDRKVMAINAEVRRLSFVKDFLGVPSDWSLWPLSPGAITYGSESLEPIRRFSERFLSPDLEVGGLRMIYDGHITENNAAFAIDFTILNRGKAPLGRVELMVAFVENADAPLSDDKVTRIVLGESLPGVVYAKKEKIYTEALNYQVINVPGFIRFAAYTADGKLLSVGNSTYKVLPK